VTTVVNLAGLLLIALIVWWFWLSRPEAQALAAKGAKEREEG
jgi:plastocyanin domain-containing protein